MQPEGPIELRLIVEHYPIYLGNEKKLREILERYYPLCQLEIDLILYAYHWGIIEAIDDIMKPGLVVDYSALGSFVMNLKMHYNLSLEYALIAVKYWLDAFSYSREKSFEFLLDNYEFKTKKFDDGRLYRGQCDPFGREHGYGTMVFPDGRKYEGYYEKGIAQGKGKMHCSDGRCFEGEWVNGAAHGKGHLILADGSEYDGEWKNGKIEGYGYYRYSDGSIYRGDFISEKRCGYGILIYADGSKYMGEWVDDCRSGYGIFYYANGGYYRGEWLKDQKNGIGYYRINDNTILDGYFKAGIFQHGHVLLRDEINNIYDINAEECNPNNKELLFRGKGYIKFGSGSIYYGDIVGISPNGRGCFKDSGGLTYEGEFSDGLFSGYGIIRTKESLMAGEISSKKNDKGFTCNLHGKAYYYDHTDGSAFFGNFVEGNRQGKGFSIDADGSIYTGDYFSEKKDGLSRWYLQGKAISFIAKDQSVYVGYYEKGNRKGKGYLINEDGSVYDGSFLDDKKNGHGRMIYPDGKIVEGIWADDELLNSETVAPNDSSGYEITEIEGSYSFRDKSTKAKKTIEVDLKKIEQVRLESDQVRDILSASKNDIAQEDNQLKPQKKDYEQEKYNTKETEYDWQAFFDKINTAYGLDVLYALIHGMNEFNVYAKKHNMMPELLLDEINEIAQDTIGDLIADNSGIFEEYASLIQKNLTDD